MSKKKYEEDIEKVSASYNGLEENDENIFKDVENDEDDTLIEGVEYGVIEVEDEEESNE